MNIGEMRNSLNHDGIISKLEKRLLEFGCNTASCEKYRIHFEYGEIDLYGISERHNSIFSVEVKTTDSNKSRRKAMQQLRKDVRYLSRLYPAMNIISFYAYSAKNNRGYEVRRIKEIK